MSVNKKYTLAERRENELKHLARFKTADFSGADIDEARRNMNSYYRLCALCERNAELENDERFCNRWSTKQSEEKEGRWFERLNKTFQETYGLELVYCGCMPSIGRKVENGAFIDEIGTWFYERS